MNVPLLSRLCPYFVILFLTGLVVHRAANPRLIVQQPASSAFTVAKQEGEDWNAAIKRTLAEIEALSPAADSSGAVLRFPRGTYDNLDTIHVNRFLKIEGEGAGHWGEITTLRFKPDQTGIVIHSHSDPKGRADCTVLSHLKIVGATTLPPPATADSDRLDSETNTGHGIVLHTGATLDHVYVTGFRLDGIHVNGGPGRNANNWRVSRCWSFSNGRHGLFAAGNDANAGVCEQLSAMDNKGWAVRDCSFLGNTYLGCHAEVNGAGAYKLGNWTDVGSVNASLLVGCYSETPQDTQLERPAGAIGGIGMDRAGKSTGYILDTYGLRNANLRKVDIRESYIERTARTITRSGNNPDAYEFFSVSFEKDFFFDCSKGNATLQIWSAADVPRYEIRVKRTDSSSYRLSIVTVDRKGIDGRNPFVLRGREGCSILSDGTNWQMMSKSP